MSKKPVVDKRVLSEMNIFMDDQLRIGKTAGMDELLFIDDNRWLKDTAVSDMVSRKHGSWEVALVFAHHINPFKLLVRYITKYHSENKARSAAFYMRKEAAKDGRGTLSVSIADINLCDN
jgi:hypothetical protein